MKPSEFVDVWNKVSLKEIAAAQSHLNDVCALVGHPRPVKADPKGVYFTFEEPTKKVGGKKGRADVWYKGKFIWEYKGFHANLDKAYSQLLLYKDFLGNPPLLITSDMHKIIIHTNFTNTVKEIYTIDLKSIKERDGVDLLKRVFDDPDSFEPDQTQKQITEATAESFLEITKIIESWAEVEKDKYDPEKVAHFIGRLFFSLFAEDMGLLPKGVLTNLAGNPDLSMDKFSKALRNLFSSMRKGGVYGSLHIRNFNGTLFDDNFMPKLQTGDIKDKLYSAAKQDWTSIDPSIFGTLFERVIDKSKRSQLGLHYTDKKDILLVIEPVVMKPLLDKWYAIKAESEKMIQKKQKREALKTLKVFAKQLSKLKVLDPACGSGNFLYVVLRQLLNLQKEVIIFAARHDLGNISLSVSPNQLYGIEKDLHAYELAQITVWIGYIQWRAENGFGDFKDPILKSLDNIKHADAVLKYTSGGRPKEPEWPAVDFIIGNPPFLGSRKMKPELGDTYCADLRNIYKDRIVGYPDLVCYWFEKARKALADRNVKRVGLLATQSIRGGTNRKVLDKVTDEGKIFMAWSDKEWILDGAMVHVSIIGFDKGKEKDTYLDGTKVNNINSSLTSTIDLSKAMLQVENSGISFQGVVLWGKFNISNKTAKGLLKEKNPSGLSNADVIKPRRTGKDVLHKAEESYVIDFDSMKLKVARTYKAPFNYIKKQVYQGRQKSPQKLAREKWWIHWRSRPDMHKALSGLKRYIATTRVGQYRIFFWLDGKVVPDNALVVFARSDDYFFGILHSKVHEVWSRRTGTQLRDAKSGFRYTLTTTFETFPFPWPPNNEPENKLIKEIAEIAKKLNEFRNSWMCPPKKDVDVIISKATVKKRTLTNLYNDLRLYRNDYKGKSSDLKRWDKESKGIISLKEIGELDYVHSKLDKTVLKAYKLPASSNEEQIVTKLLKLNLKRAATR